MAERDVRVKLTLEAAGNAEKAMKGLAAEAKNAATGMEKLKKEGKEVNSLKGDQAARGLKDIGSAAEKATTSLKAMNAEQAKARQGGGVGGVPARPPAAQPVQAGGVAPRPGVGVQAPAPGGGGLFSQANVELLGTIGGAVAALQTFAKGVQTAATAIDALKDSSLSAGQAQRKIAESIPVLGEFNKAMFQLSDAITGRTEAIRKTQRDTVVGAATSQANLAAFQQGLPVREQLFSIEAQQRARQANPLPAFNAPGRDSLQGEIAFAQFERRRPLELSQRDARIQAQVAQETAQDAARRRTELQAQADAARQERERAQESLAQLKRDQESGRDTRPGSSPRGSSFLPKRETDLKLPGLPGTVKAGEVLPGFFFDPKTRQAAQGLQGSLATSEQEKARLEALGKVDAALKNELQLKQQLIATEQQQASAVKASVEAESKLRQANIALLKDEMQTLKEREQAVKGQAQAFGGLDASQRFSALQAAQQFKERGFGSLTADQRGLIQAAGGGQALAFAAQQSAQSDPGFAQFAQALGLESDLKKIQEKQVEVAAEIELKVELDTQQVSEQFTKALKPLLEDLLKQFKEFAEATIEQVKVGIDIANASQ